MIINELNLLGFGRFENKKIILDEGLNIIYGSNEAGKTTVHNFINGMFYGFLKPYVKRAIYLDEHEMYRPWSGKKYMGMLKFETDNSDYMIEREFTRSEESTRIFLESTGEDVTNSIETKDKTRIVQPGNYFFGFNDAVYGNTISVKQSSNKIEEDLSKEIKDKLINLSTSMDNEVSTQRAVAELERAIKSIGSTRAPTSYYGRTSTKFTNLEDEKQEILKSKDEYLQALDDKADIDKNINLASGEIKQLEEKLKEIKLLEKFEIYIEAKAIKEQITSLKQEKDKLEKYKEFSLDDYLKGINLDKEIDGINKRNIELKENLLDVEETIEKIEKEKGLNKELDKSIEEDFLKYEKLEEEKNQATSTNNHEIEFLKRDINETKRKNSSIKNILIFSAIISVLSIILSFSLDKVFLWINLISLPLLIFNISKNKKVKTILNEQKNNLENLEKVEEEKVEIISQIERDKQIILEKYNVDNKIDLKRIFDEYNITSYRDKDENRLMEEYVNRKTSILQNLESYKTDHTEKDNRLKLILNKNLASTLDQLKEGVDKGEEYKELKAKIDSKEELLERVIGELSFEELENQCKKSDINFSENEEKISSSDLNIILKEKYENLSELKIKKSSNDSRIEFLDRSISKLVLIEESIYDTNKLLNSLDEKIKSLELAKNTIEKLSKDIQREFAPLLNRRVGSIIDRVTKGKYTNIKIDDKLQMGVIDNTSGEIIDLKDLSGGTIDQLYFALRFGIINSLTEKRPPLILDDCFVQYDNSRLENMMDLLLEEAKTRQIILFTCHKRESEILNNKKTQFNLVDLELN